MSAAEQVAFWREMAGTDFNSDPPYSAGRIHRLVDAVDRHLGAEEAEAVLACLVRAAIDERRG